MIRKKEILEGICDLNTDMTELAIKLNELDKRVKSLEKKGKAKSQPRDKSGKFSKK